MSNSSILAAFERMWLHVVAALGDKANLNHNHNDLYYTETEVDTKLSTKSDTNHNHNDLYCTKSELNTKSSVIIREW